MESMYSYTQSRHVEDEKFCSITWEAIVEACKFDKIAIKLNHTIREGFPARQADLDPLLKNFWHNKDELYTLEGCSSQLH